jgi:secondary thiamine-phosphate synthase enzyme
MAAATTRFEIRTHRKAEAVNVTPEVRRAVAQSKVRCGLALVSVSHTTCGVCLNEDESGLRDDLVRLVSQLLDPLEGGEPFRHDRVDDNARSHLVSILVGPSITLPVADGDLRLGTWQSVLLVEMDGPRTRRVDVTCLGD